MPAAGVAAPGRPPAGTDDVDGDAEGRGGGDHQVGLREDRARHEERQRAEEDRECFGPLVQIAIASDLDDAIDQANATRYGLAASIFTRDDATWDRFLRECRAGCVNRNCGTAGASGTLRPSMTVSMLLRAEEEHSCSAGTRTEDINITQYTRRG